MLLLFGDLGLRNVFEHVTSHFVDCMRLVSYFAYIGCYDWVNSLQC